MPKSEKSRSIAIDIVGGIGNQLFCLFFGLYISEVTSKELLIDMTSIESNKSNHGGSIKSFSFYRDLTQASKLKISIYRFITSCLRRLTHYPKTRSFFMKIFKVYLSDCVGFDQSISNNTSSRYFSGYFQSCKYLQHLRDNHANIKFEIKHPSQNFIKIERRIEAEKPIIMHIRRGDYRVHAPSYGLLSSEYYEQALIELRNLGVKGTILVFSDDVVAAKELLRGIQNFEFEFFTENEIKDPAEVMLLMSKGPAIIIANSTFSWWAAQLGSLEKIVVRPSKWFRNLEDPNQLFPKKWISVESSWEV